MRLSTLILITVLIISLGLNALLYLELKITNKRLIETRKRLRDVEYRQFIDDTTKTKTF